MNELQGKIIEVRLSTHTEATRKTGESLREMRRLSGLTQAQMAKRLKVGQASVSGIEADRGDIQLPVVRKFVEALGGTLRITAAFPAEGALSLHMCDAPEARGGHGDELSHPVCTDDTIRPDRDMVLSIRPKHASRIMAGEKTVELRRRFPVSAPKGTIAYIYSSSPERAMVGHAVIAGVHKLDVEEIWRLYADAACAARVEFDSYFEGLNEGFALEFADVRRYPAPVSLSYLREHAGFQPPQSFLYAKRELKRVLKDRGTTVSH